MGISPSTGILSTESDVSSSIKPPKTMVCPSCASTLVLIVRLLVIRSAAPLAMPLLAMDDYLLRDGQAHDVALVNLRHDF